MYQPHVCPSVRPRVRFSRRRRARKNLISIPPRSSSDRFPPSSGSRIVRPFRQPVQVHHSTTTISLYGPVRFFYTHIYIFFFFTFARAFNYRPVRLGFFFQCFLIFLNSTYHHRCRPRIARGKRLWARRRHRVRC